MDTKLAILGGERTIPEGRIRPWPPIDDEDRRLVMASLEQDNHAFGPNCRAFEQEYAAWNGNQFAITTNSGTAALHMAVAACGCGIGDEVIVTAYSWSSSASCILHHDAIPVFVDIDFATMNIDVNKIEAAITPRTKAIIVVHLHGLPVDLEPVLSLAKRHNLRVIEDACQAHGAVYKGRKVGTWGDCAAFSFNQNKLLCSGEGGMFVTDDEALLEKAKSLWSFGETRTPVEDRDYHAYALGWMYRNNDLTAAFGRAQLRKLDSHLATIRANAEVLTAALQGLPKLLVPTETEDCRSDWYNYTVRFDLSDIEPAERSEFRFAIVKALAAEGVPTSVWQRFILPAMTVFQAKNAYGKGYPWASPEAAPVDYSPENYPIAQHHSDTHTGMTIPIRPPNGPDVAKLVGTAFEKVMTKVDSQLDLFRETAR